MNKRQANTIITLGVAIILTQILCTAILNHNMERTRKEAEAAQVSAMDTLEMQKQAAGRPSTGSQAVEAPSAEPERVDAQPVISRSDLATEQAKLETDEAELEKLSLCVQDRQGAIAFERQSIEYLQSGQHTQSGLPYPHPHAKPPHRR